MIFTFMLADTSVFSLRKWAKSTGIEDWAFLTDQTIATTFACRRKLL